MVRKEIAIFCLLLIAACKPSQETIDDSHITGTWTYVTDGGRGIGRLSFREDGTFSETFNITTGVGTTATSTRGTWKLTENAISVQYNSTVATGLASGGGATSSMSGTSTYPLRGGVIYVNGAPYVKE